MLWEASGVQMSERRRGAAPEADPNALDHTCKARGFDWGVQDYMYGRRKGAVPEAYPKHARPCLT